MPNQIWTAGTILVTITGILYLLNTLKKRLHAVSVRDKVVLITGATSGLGEACAHVLYRAGAKVILTARREAELHRVKNDLINSKSKEGHPTREPRVLSMDLEEFSAIQEKVAEAVSMYGTVDILINNAGISYRGRILDTKLDVDVRVMNVNYFGQVALTKALLPCMIEKNSGHIIVISSVQGKLSIPYRSPYSASKHALQAFFDCLRSEVAEHNIRVSVLSPGYIQTNLSQNAITGDGSVYGVTDANTAQGMTSQQMAQRILEAIQYNKQEEILSTLSHKIVIYLRNIFPELFFWLMKSRARKLKTDLAK